MRVGELTMCSIFVKGFDDKLCDSTSWNSGRNVYEASNVRPRFWSVPICCSMAAEESARDNMDTVQLLNAASSANECMW